jgi:hypothetical protein
MNQEEKAAEKYLYSISLGVPIYEPEGFKRPPDFGLGGTIGIEVRRLNQNYLQGDTSSGLEELSIPLHMTLEKVLESFDARFEGHSFWVSMSYKRPLPCKSGVLARAMTDALSVFLNGTRSTPCHLKVNDNIEFEIRSSETTVPNRVFRHAITSDDDSGGLVVQMYVSNILHCITDKKMKLAPVKHKYNEWWLVLVDTMMAWNLEAYEVGQIRAGICEYGDFNRIIVLDYFGDKCLLRIDPQSSGLDGVA